MSAVIYIYIYITFAKKVVVEIIFCINIDSVQSKMVPFTKKKIYAQYNQLWTAGEKVMLWLDNNSLAS